MSVAVAHVVHERPDLPAGAPTVVLAGSLGSTSDMWLPQVDALTEHFRVVRYDARGHGCSPVPVGPYSIDDLADDLVALLDHLGVRRAHLVGLSLGGMAVMRVAAREPDRVERLAVLCTAAVLGPAEAWLARAATVRAEGTAAIAEAVVGRWFTPGLRAARPERVAAAVAMVAATPAEGYASCCEAIAAMDLVDQLPSITAPTLAVAGADDPATPPEHLERIAEGVVDGRLVTVPDAAHLASDEQPAIVNAALLEHLAGTRIG